MMEEFSTILLWGSLFGVAYTYIGYPFLLFIWKRLAARPIKRGVNGVTTVSIVIAARNEAPRLATRIENCLAQFYPPDCLQVIVVSDGSTDETEQVVRRYDASRVTFLSLPGHQGKAMALNAGVAHSQSDIIVFADARQRFDPRVVDELVRSFADPTVGAVTGELVLHPPLDRGCAEAAGVYWTMEKWIRRAEGEVDSVVGTTGAIYAIRRNLFDPLPRGTILDDVLLPMRIVMKGYRVVFEPRAQAFDQIEEDYRVEFRRKVRTLAGNYQAIAFCPNLLKPWRNRLFVQFVSHKVCRLVAPLWLIILFLTNLMIMEGWLRYMLALQIIGYTMAGIGWCFSRVGIRERWTAAAYTFCLLHYAALIGAVKFLWNKDGLWDNAREVPIVGALAQADEDLCPPQDASMQVIANTKIGGTAP